MEKFEPTGGTEILKNRLFSQLSEAELTNINFLISNTHESMIDKEKINILWNHHNVDQPAIQNMRDPNFIKKIDYFVYVSNWQYEKYRYKYNIPEYKSLVIKNAIDLLQPIQKPKKIKLIYTSTPWRGLDVLLDSFRRLNRDDVELDIYSSTIIYGTDFHKQNESTFLPLFNQAKSMKNVNFHGYADNQDVRKALLGAHIFAYPSTWEETSCLATIEAGMAGLSLVTTNLGALFETTGGWGKLVSFDSNKKNLAIKFAHALDIAINEFWQPNTQEKLSAQISYFQKFWGWDTRILEWKNFLNQVNQQ